LALTHLAERAGFPPGVINVVLCNRIKTPLIGHEFTTNDAVKKISFTGSTPVGKILMRQSASTLKKLSLELGGNAPFIVFEDADLDAAVAGAIASKFRSSGQTCVCANRLFVHESVYDEFADKLVAAVNKFQVGDGAVDGTTHGPLIHSRAVDKVHHHVNDAVAKGAKVLTGGKRMHGNFYAPTVLGDVPAHAAVMSEETFGPMGALVKFNTEEEVIERANDTDVGLAGYFFSKDVGRAFRVAEALEVGMVGVNTGLISQASMAFGGWGESGQGREGSKYGIDDYLNIKNIVIRV